MQRTSTMNDPKKPAVPSTTPNAPAGPRPNPQSPLDPDPKSHPIHREVPVQPIHEGAVPGTDPKKPVRRGGDGQSGAV
jgi:hypothetical protein